MSISLLSAWLMVAVAAPESAEVIAKQALEKNLFSTTNARAEVELKVSKKSKVTRVRRVQTKMYRTDEMTGSYIEFLSPSDVVGTKFLSKEHKDGSTEQLIYLPALKKVKRVVGTQRKKSFMGTDFSYEDLEGRDAQNANWRRLDDDKIGGQRCYVVEGIPKKRGDEPYAKTILWVHQKYLVPMRIDFFENETRVLKRFSVRRLEKKSRRWVAMDAVMATLPKNTSTRMVVLRVDFDRPIAPEELTRRALER